MTKFRKVSMFELFPSKLSYLWKRRGGGPRGSFLVFLTKFKLDLNDFSCEWLVLQVGVRLPFFGQNLGGGGGSFPIFFGEF